MFYKDYLSPAQRAKVDCLASGVRITESAIDALSLVRSGRPLALAEYPTTGGIIFKLEGAGYVNAPFTGIFAERPTFEIHYGSDVFVLRRINADEEHPIEIVPLPGFVHEDGSREFGRAMIVHTERVRIEIVNGCSFHCGFCDLNHEPYGLNDKEMLLRAIRVANDDPVLPINHAMISGGTSKKEDEKAVDEVYEYLLSQPPLLKRASVLTPLPMDVMLAPRADDRGLIDRLYGWGAREFSINIELFGQDRAKIIPEKAAIGLNAYGHAIKRAVELTGGKGRVHSLLVVGIEPMEATLNGVAWLAERGCYPVLSPFRPAPNTPLADHPIPTADFLAELWLRSKEIADHFNVDIGMPCVGCQHNDLAFPHTNLGLS